MKKVSSKYNYLISVCWRDVLRCLKWALKVRLHDAERWIDYVQCDTLHNYPDDLDSHMQSALKGCENVFYQLDLLNTVRRFLRYPDMTREQLHVTRCFEFYERYKKESPGSDSLAASTTRGQTNNE